MKKRAAVLIILTRGFLVDHFSMTQQISTENAPDGVLFLNQKGRFQLFQGETPFTQIDENRTDHSTLLFKEVNPPPDRLPT